MMTTTTNDEGSERSPLASASERSPLARPEEDWREATEASRWREMPGSEAAELNRLDREACRLLSKPPIDHLEDGAATLEDGTVVPLFDVGDRIVVERWPLISGSLPTWLDTRAYIVKGIDDETLTVKCWDPTAERMAFLGFGRTDSIVKLAPGTGDPFNPQKRVWRTKKITRKTKRGKRK